MNRILPNFWIEVDVDGMMFSYERHQLRLHARQTQFINTSSSSSRGEVGSPPPSPSLSGDNSCPSPPDPEMMLHSDDQAVIESMCAQFGALRVIEVALNCCLEDDDIVRAYDLASRRRYGTTFPWEETNRAIS